MSEELPPPLIGAHVDLRSFPEMPIAIERLLNSDSWLIASGDERACMLTLWLKSWHQLPAGSLPSDWRLLAQLSGAYHEWGDPAFKAEVILSGWVKCSDGRLYHPVVCEYAQRLWDNTKGKSDAGREAANRRWNKHKPPDAVAMPTQCKLNITEQNITSSKKVVCAGAPKSKRSRTSLPEIWPNDLDRAWALKHWREKGREDLCELADDQMKEARDHHLGAGTMSADWPATWRTWATRAIRYNRKGRDHDRKPTAHENMQRGTLLALDRIAGRQ